MTIQGHTVRFKQSFYKADDSKAILVEMYEEDYEDWSPFGTLTVCLPENNLHVLEDDEFIVKTWSENSVFIELIDKGLFERTDKTINSGYVIAEIWKLTDFGKKYIQ